jgi:hypothetical protein
MATTEEVTAAVKEQTRARYPDEEGYVERDGVRVSWERYGEGEPTILLPPTWEIVHSRFWKAQIPLSGPAQPGGGGHLVRQGESLILAAEHPERVAGLVLIGPPVSAYQRQGPGTRPTPATRSR